MTRRRRCAALAMAFAVPIVAAGVSHAQVGIGEVWEDDLYSGYGVGYDHDFGDDWFYDQYELGDGLMDTDGIGSDFYSDYDYQTDEFFWEEEGIF